MDKNKINKIIDSDSKLEAIMAKAMRQVGKEHDSRLIAQMAAMDEDDFRRDLEKSKVRVSAFSRFFRSGYFRAAAACIVCAFLIWGAGFLPFSETSSSAYASMYKQYYTAYNAQPYDAQGDNLNAHGNKSTAQIIQDASELLSQSSRQSTRRAIEMLEQLQDNPWRKKGLDPEIHWYLGLAYLKNGQEAEARDQFKIVRDSGKAHADQAAQILAEIAIKKKKP